jgi:LppX_LprAFG lipoprotein
MRRSLLALPVALALIAGGCGEESVDDNPLAALDTAARKTKAAESFEQQFMMESDLEGAVMSMEGEGTFSADSTRGVMTADMEIEGDKLAFDAIVDEGVMYLKSDDIPLPDGKEWFKTSDPPANTLSPSEFVSFLRGSEGVENVGTEEIRGEQTTHFRGPLDWERLAQETDSELIRSLENTPQIKQMRFIVDVWVASTGLPSRLAMDVTAPEQADGSMTVTAEMLEYNVDVDVEAPPASEVAELPGG